MSPPSSPRRRSMTWKLPPRQPGMRSSSACSKRNGTRLTPHWSSSIARLFPPAIVHADGDEPVTVASRFGTLELARQVCCHPALQTHIMPGNSLLPPHHGIIITRGLQEWACLLPQELPFAAVARLLGLPNARGACAVRYHCAQPRAHPAADRKSTRLNSSHVR